MNLIRARFANPTGRSGQRSTRRLIALLATLTVAFAGLSLPVPARASEATFAPGDLDASFGNDGVVTVADFTVDGVALQSDGKAVIVGTRSYIDLGTSAFQLERYDTLGVRDNGFGQVFTVIPDAFVWAHGIAIQSDDDGDERIIVAGMADQFGGTTSSVVVARYTLEGKLDGEFGTDGIAMVDREIGGRLFYASDVAVQPSDGKIVLGGFVDELGYPGGRQAAAVRFNADGEIDSSFGTDGLAAAPFAFGYGGIGVQTIAGIDRVILGGWHPAPTTFATFGLARLSPQGALDSVFGGGVPGMLTDIAVLPDGTITAVGEGGYEHEYVRHAVVAVYDPDGDLSASAMNHIVGWPSVAVQPPTAGEAPKIVIAGGGWVGDQGSGFAVARYDVPLSLDSSFGDAGTAVSDFGGYAHQADHAVEADGDIVVAGIQAAEEAPYQNRGLLARYHGTGDAVPEVCVDQTIGFGAIEAAGCFTHPEPTMWEATGNVRMNGIDLKPEGTITLDAAEATLTVAGEVVVSVGEGDNRIALITAADIEWDLSGEMTLALPEAFTLKGFPVEGEAKVTWSGGEVDVELKVGLPKVLGGVTAGATLSADMENGLHLDSLSIGVATAKIGPVLELKDLGVKYSFKDDSWTGNGKVVLASGIEITAELTFTAGEFTSGSASLGKINKPIATGVFLQSISFGVETDPFTLTGEAGISAGPEVMGGTAASLLGKLSYTFDDPDIFKVSGTLNLVDQELAEGFIEYISTGKVNLAGQLTFDQLGMQIDGRLEGWVSGTEKFNVEGEATVNVGIFSIQGKAVASSKGMAACGILYDDVRAGVGYQWGGDAEFLEGCDLGDYVEQPLALGASGAYQVAEGLPVAAFAVTGESAPPAFTLVGPNGESVEAVNDGFTPDGHLVVVNPANNTTYVALARPAGGSWSVEMHKGSSPVTSVRRSEGLPKPEVKASVDLVPNPLCLTCPAQAVLSWDVAPIDGQSVTFAEVDSVTSNVIGTADGTSGSITFTPGTGELGSRQIVALVEQDGLPRTNLEVASF